MHLYQYQTQIQERDKQLVAFRDQHKEIIQNLELKYQQKVTQLVQQIQELQSEMKKLRLQKQGMPAVAMQPKAPGQMPTQQFSQSLHSLKQQPQFVSGSSSITQRLPNILTRTSASQPPLPPSKGPASLQQSSQHILQPQNLGPLSNPAPPKQLPSPLTPKPAAGAIAPGGSNQSLSWIGGTQSTVGNQGGNPAMAPQGMNPGNQQQQQPLQPGSQSVMHPSAQQGHMTQDTAHPQGIQGGQNYPQSSSQQLRPELTPANTTTEICLLKSI